MYTFENIMEDLVDVTDEYLDSYQYSLTHTYPKQKRHHSYDYYVVETLLDASTHHHFVKNPDSELLTKTVKQPQVYNQYRLYVMKPRLQLLLEQYQQQHPDFEPSSLKVVDRISGDHVVYMPLLPDVLYFDTPSVEKAQALINRFVFNGGIEDDIEHSTLVDFLNFANQNIVS